MGERLFKSEEFDGIEWAWIGGELACVAELGQATLMVKRLKGLPEVTGWQPWAIGATDGSKRVDRPTDLDRARRRALEMAIEINRPADHGLKPEDLNASNDG